MSKKSIFALGCFTLVGAVLAAAPAPESTPPAAAEAAPAPAVDISKELEAFSGARAKGDFKAAVAALAACEPTHEGSVAILRACGFPADLGLIGDFDEKRARRAVELIGLLLESPALTDIAKDVLRVRDFAARLRLGEAEAALARLAAFRGRDEAMDDAVGEIDGHLRRLEADASADVRAQALPFLEAVIAANTLTPAAQDAMRVRAFATLLKGDREGEAIRHLSACGRTAAVSEGVVAAVDAFVKRVAADKDKAAGERRVFALLRALVAADALADEGRDAVRSHLFTLYMEKGDLDAALGSLGGCGKSARLVRTVHRMLRALLAKTEPDRVVPLLELLLACDWFRPADYVGQLAEDQFIRFAGDGGAKPADVARLRALLDFSGRMLDRPALLSAPAAAALRERRLDGYFLSNDYDGAIACIDRGGFANRTPAWCKGTAAKLRAHKAMEAGNKREAVRQLLVFGDFMLSEEQKDFEDCDPTTGVVYSRDWVLARNYMRCAKMSREVGDAANAGKYLAEAKRYFVTAHEKAKDDRKSLDTLRDEMKADGIPLPALETAKPQEDKAPAAK